MATIQLTGILEDGSPRGALVPKDARQVLRVTKSVDYTIRVSVQTSSGSPVAITGTTYALAVRKTNESGALVINPALVGAVNLQLGTNVVEFTLTDTQTRNLVPGIYLYDVLRVTGAGLRDIVIPTSAFYLSSTPGRN